MRRDRNQRIQALAVAGLLLLAITPSVAGAGHWHSCFGERVTIRGTSGADVLHGTTGRDVMVGMGGDDTLFGNSGNDVLCGNRGDDTLLGADGQDRASGGKGQDFCSAEHKRGCES